MVANSREEGFKVCRKQRATPNLHCIIIEMRTPPTAAMEALLNPVPLNVLNLGETSIWVFRLRLKNNWKTSRGYSGIEQVITNLTLEMGSDCMISHKPLKTTGENYLIHGVSSDIRMGVKRIRELVWNIRGWLQDARSVSLLWINA